MPDWVWLIMAIVGGIITTLAERRGKKKATVIAAGLTRQLDAVITGVEKSSDLTTKVKIKTESMTAGVEGDLRDRVKRITELLK